MLPVFVVGISITAEQTYDIDEFELSDIGVVLERSKGEEVTIPFTLDLVDEAHRDLLDEVGTHTIRVNYQAFNAEFTLTLTEEAVYEIVFITYDGHPIDPITVIAGEPIPELPVLTAEGHIFKGWQSEYFDGFVEVGLIMPEQDLEFFAVWEPMVFMITFETGIDLEIDSLQIEFNR